MARKEISFLWWACSALAGCFVSNAVVAGDPGEFLERDEVRAAVEAAVETSVCSDQALLDFLQIDMRGCRNRLTKINPVCWGALDKLVPDYAVPANQTGQERFFDIVYVYLYCARAELLAPIVKRKVLTD